MLMSFLNEWSRIGDTGFFEIEYNNTVIFIRLIFSTFGIMPRNYLYMIGNKWRYMAFEYCGIPSDHIHVINLGLVELVNRWNIRVELDDNYIRQS